MSTPLADADGPSATNPYHLYERTPASLRQLFSDWSRVTMFDVGRHLLTNGEIQTIGFVVAEL